MIFDIVLILVMLFGVLVSLYTDLSDLKGGIVPDRLTYTLIVFGLVFHIGLSLVSRSFVPVLFSLFGAGVGFFVGFVLYYFGWMGGGDLKLLVSIGALVPSSPTPILMGSVPLSSYPVSPVVVLVNGVLLEAPFVLLFVVYCLVRGKNILSKEVLISELEGLEIVDEAVYRKDGVVRVEEDLPSDYSEVFADPSDLSGLDEDDISELSRLSEEGEIPSKIRVKRSYPFVPVIAAGVFSLVLFGNLYWNFLLFFL